MASEQTDDTNTPYNLLASPKTTNTLPSSDNHEPPKPAKDHKVNVPTKSKSKPKKKSARLTADNVVKLVTKLRHENKSLRQENLHLRHELALRKNKVTDLIQSDELDKFERSLAENMSETASVKIVAKDIVTRLTDLIESMSGGIPIETGQDEEYDEKVPVSPPTPLSADILQAEDVVHMLSLISQDIQSMVVDIVTSNSKMIECSENVLTAIERLDETGEDDDDDDSSSIVSDRSGADVSSTHSQSQSDERSARLKMIASQSLSSQSINNGNTTTAKYAASGHGIHFTRPTRHDLKRMAVSNESKNRLKSEKDLTLEDDYTRLDLHEFFDDEDRKFNEADEESARRKRTDFQPDDIPEIIGTVVKGNMLRKRMWFKIAIKSEDTALTRRKIFVERRLDHFRELYQILREEFDRAKQPVGTIPHMIYIKHAALWKDVSLEKAKHDLAEWLEQCAYVREVAEHSAYQTFTKHSIEAWRTYRAGAFARSALI